MDHCYQTLYLKEVILKISAIFGVDLNLTVFENGTAWKVNVSKEEIAEQSKDVEINEYNDKLKRYFRSCPEDVEFNFVRGKLTISLLLKNQMEILFFTCTLKQVDFVENVLNLVDKLFHDKTHCLEEMNTVQKQNEILHNDNEILKEKLDIFLDRRKTEEQKLYSKFLVLLNKKKQQIQHQKDLLIAARKGRLMVNNKEKSNKSKLEKNVQVKKETNNDTNSESDDSSNLSDNYNTDNEEKDKSNQVSNTSLIPPRKNNSSGASTSKSTTNFMEDLPTTSFTFSKRIRTDADSSLNIPLPKTTCNETIKTEYKNNAGSEHANSNSIPTVNFNTQDLLDNL